MNFVIVGGGTAGFLSALIFKNKYPNLNVTVISSSYIGTLGPGEGLTPNIHRVLKDLDISIETFLKETNGTIKNGVNFVNWGIKHKTWFHGFYDIINDTQNIFNDNKHFFKNYKTGVGLGENLDNINFGSILSYKNKVLLDDKNDFAFHIDAKKLGDFLQNESVKRGISIIDGIVVDAINDDLGNISKLILEDGVTINCDFVVDCTGFKRVLIGKHYKTTWSSVSKYLPATSAIACKLPIKSDPVPYTEAIAMNYGWAWKIPLQNRYGCGYVYDSKYINSDEAEAELKKQLGNDLEVVGRFTFDPGYFEKIWVNNCLSIGISSSFIEPLEATTITMMIDVIYAFIDKFFDEYRNNLSLKNGAGPHLLFNKIWVEGIQSIVAFLYLHYITKKTNTEFWENFEKDHPMPEFGSNNVRMFLSRMDKDLYHTDILTPLSWKLYSWILVYAGNELSKYSVQLDNDDIEEYNDIKMLVDEKTNAGKEYKEYLEYIIGGKDERN